MSTDHRMDGFIAESAKARTSSNPEIPSAMLTSPYIDFMIDPHLFKGVSGSDSRPRNVRLLYLSSLISGAFVGGGLHRAGVTLTVLWVAFGLKLIVMAWIYLADHDEEDLLLMRVDGAANLRAR